MYLLQSPKILLTETSLPHVPFTESPICFPQKPPSPQVPFTETFTSFLQKPPSPGTFYRNPHMLPIETSLPRSLLQKTHKCFIQKPPSHQVPFTATPNASHRNLPPPGVFPTEAQDFLLLTMCCDIGVQVVHDSGHGS